ncbi:MAG: sodium/solute symporter [Thermoguttaceae bacterium]|nr:sodium/solute symporter [Thermoguttaceae bacterium]
MKAGKTSFDDGLAKVFSPFSTFPFSLSSSLLVCSLSLLPLLLISEIAQSEAPSVVEAPEWLTWERVAELPDGVQPETVRLAESRGTLLLFGQTAEAEPDHIWALLPGAWAAAGAVPDGVWGATVVSIPEAVLFLGGQTADGPSDRVFRIRWQADVQQTQIETGLPRLPVPCRGAAGANIGTEVYVAGGLSQFSRHSGHATQSTDHSAAKMGLSPLPAPSTFWVLDLAAAPEARRWEPLPEVPGPARSNAAMVAQSDGERPGVFLFGGTDAQGQPLADAYRFDVAGGRWYAIALVPGEPALRPAAALGQAHVALFGQPMLGYHTITDTWIRPGAGAPATFAAARWSGELGVVAAAPGEEDRPAVYRASLHRARRRLGGLDFTVLALYLAVLVAMGFYFSRREGSTAQFFLGGQKIPWWAAGLSLLATQVSSIGFMAIPAKSFATDWAYFAGVFTWFLVVPVVTAVYIPLFRRLNVTSAYEYLESRFNLPVRLFGSAAYSFMQLGRMAVVLYLPALALAAVTGLDHRACIVTMGVLCTVYTVAGGIEAVVWTDVLQAVVLVGGAVLCVAVVLAGIDGGPARFIEVAAADNKFSFGPLYADVAAASLWVIVLGNLFTRLAGLTSDQAIVQRYMTTPDTRQSVRALWADVAVSIPWAVIAFSFGTALYVFYKLHPERLSPAVDLDGLVPLFVAQQLPAGVSGLIIAAIFAAAMSSLDSSMHSTATVWVTDFYARFRPRSSDHSRLRLARLLTVVLGAFGTLTALALAQTGIHSLWDLFQGIVGLFAGGLAGLFVLGLFTRRTNGASALLGAVASAGLLYLARPHVHFFLYPVVGMTGCVVIGYLGSFLFPGRPKVDVMTA